MSILSSTGGLHYLLKAWRYRNSRWAPFLASMQAQVQEWCARAQAQGARRLWIFGPNAGWTLPPKLAQGFASVVAVEPDPMAMAILRRRRLRAGAEVIHRADSPLTRNPEDLRRWLRTEVRDGDAVLFSNLLGQWSLFFRDSEQSRQDAFIPVFRDLFARVPTATYHDRLSGKFPAGVLAEVLGGFSREFVRSDRVIAELEKKMIGDVAEIELCDHGLDDFFTEIRAPRRNEVWEISPGVFHWIEWIG